MAHFLIVEDNAANRELLRYIMAAFGHEISCAPDGEEGLRLARAKTPDMVLCDLRMPRLDGYAMLTAIRNDPVLFDTVMIAVTAYSMPGDREDALRAGFDGYLTKPIDPQTVVAEVEALLLAGRVKPA